MGDFGAMHWRSHCHLLIQRTWRSFVCVKEFRTMQDTIEPTSPRGKEKFLLRKFRKTNRNVMSSLDQRSNDLDDFLASIDNSIAASRVVFGAMGDEGHTECCVECTKDGRPWSGIKQIALKRG